MGCQKRMSVMQGDGKMSRRKVQIDGGMSKRKENRKNKTDFRKGRKGPQSERPGEGYINYLRIITNNHD